MERLSSPEGHPPVNGACSGKNGPDGLFPSRVEQQVVLKESFNVFLRNRRGSDLSPLQLRDVQNEPASLLRKNNKLLSCLESSGVWKACGEAEQGPLKVVIFLT